MTLLKINVLLVITLMINLSGQAQNLATEASNEFLQVRQIPNSNDKLQRYFSEYASSDTVYAIIFPPANCPRCEAVINPIFQNLKQLRPGTPTVLVAVYPEADAAKAYINRYAFVADSYLYDETDAFKEFLSFNAGYLHIPYLIKVVPATGEMVIGIEASSNNVNLLRDFCAFNGYMEKQTYRLSMHHESCFRPNKHSLTYKKTYTLSHPDSLTLSEIINQVEFCGDKLFFNDKLREAIEYFTISEQDSTVMEFCSELVCNSEQNHTYVQVADSIYMSMLADNSVRFIPLSPKMLDSRTVAISYSLPNLWYVDTNIIGYKNQACVLLVDTETNESRVMPLVTSEDDGYFYPHFSLFTVDGQLAIGCERMTWPMEFEKEAYCDIDEFNPFSESFYAYTQPIIALFDSHNGQLIERIGNLPSLARHTRTGYYFTNPTIDSWKGQTAITDGFSGGVDLFCIGDTTNVKHLNAFNIPPSSVSMPDSTLFYSYDCVEPYVGVFNRTITDLKISDNYVYCLVKYGIHGTFDAVKDIYSVIRIDSTCNCSIERSFGAVNENTRSYYGLRRNENGSVDPYTITRQANRWQVNLYEFTP